jgi:vesicle-fusing ATPase
LQITTNKNGFINDNVNINIYSDDVTLNLVGSKLLKRDLFRDDYNFEEIGIGGLNKELIGVFRRALSTRAFKPIIAEKLGIKHVKGILLYGLPGCGKTLIARKIGSMITDKEPKIINGPEIMNKFVGQSEENIRNLFVDAKLDSELNNNNASLHVIIFDEIDAICKSRGRSGTQSGVNDTVVNQLLSMIDGVNQLNNIFIIAMTNRKDLLDDALLRAGRIEVHIEVGLPDLEGRKQIFRIHTNKMQTNSMMDKTVDIKLLSKLTDNFSGAEIESVVKNAGSLALHEQLTSNKKEIKDNDIIVTMNHFLQSVNDITPSFGNINKKILSLLPEKYVRLTYSHSFCYDKTNEFIKKNRRIKTILICGESGTGKTILASKIAFDNKIKYTKIIRAIDMVSFDEYMKAYYISDAVTNSYVSEESLIVLDDMEIAINYANFGNNVTFSNKLYQTLITLLKTEPTMKSHQLTLIVTCSDTDFYNVISKHFDLTFNIEKILQSDIPNVITSLGHDFKNKNISNDVTIRELLNNI